jgi:hypothetical protein
LQSLGPPNTCSQSTTPAYCLLGRLQGFESHFISDLYGGDTNVEGVHFQKGGSSYLVFYSTDETNNDDDFEVTILSIASERTGHLESDGKYGKYLFDEEEKAALMIGQKQLEQGLLVPQSQVDAYWNR